MAAEPLLPEARRYLLVTTTWWKGRPKTVVRETANVSEYELLGNKQAATCVHALTAPEGPISKAVLEGIRIQHDSLLRRSECKCCRDLGPVIEEVGRARSVPVRVRTSLGGVEADHYWGTTTELSTMEIQARLVALHGITSWRFFYVRANARVEISCSGRLLRCTLPLQSGHVSAVDLLAEEPAVLASSHATEAKSCDLLEKLVFRAFAPDDLPRQGEKENAKRKLRQFLDKKPELEPLARKYRRQAAIQRSVAAS